MDLDVGVVMGHLMHTGMMLALRAGRPGLRRGVLCEVRLVC